MYDIPLQVGDRVTFLPGEGVTTMWWTAEEEVDEVFIIDDIQPSHIMFKRLRDAWPRELYGAPRSLMEYGIIVPAKQRCVMEAGT